jgi:hypothetical protein
MYTCPSAWYLICNAGIAAVTLLANGGALAIAISDPSDPLSSLVVRDTVVSLPVAGITLLLSLLAWLRPRLTGVALRIQAFALVLLAVYLVQAAVAQFAAASPGGRDMWVAGYFTLALFYAAVTVVRFGIGQAPAPGAPTFFLPAVVAAVAAIVDLTVFAHAFAS